jgi:hypothetical protein
MHIVHLKGSAYSGKKVLVCPANYAVRIYSPWARLIVPSLILHLFGEEQRIVVEGDASSFQFVAIDPPQLTQVLPLGIVDGWGSVGYVTVARSPFEKSMINLGASP